MSDDGTILDSYHLGEILRPSARVLGERVGAKAVELLAARLTALIGPGDEDQYSNIWRSAIEDHEQDSAKDDARSVLVDALRDACLGATRSKGPDSDAAVEGLLTSEYPTLVRTGIFVCGEHYGNLRDVFWRNFKQEWFSRLVFWHEVFWFIKKAFPSFSSSEHDKFLAMVESVHGEWADSSRSQELNEGLKRDLLHPAFGTGDEEVDRRYMELVGRVGAARERPDFHVYTTSGWVHDGSPVAPDALIRMGDEELVQFLNTFVPDRREEATYRGVAASISEAVRASEDGFSSRIHLFRDLARPYQHGVLRGLKERFVEDMHDIDWPAVLALMSAIADSPGLKSELSNRSAGWEPTVHWVISDLADLVKAAADAEPPVAASVSSGCLLILSALLKQLPPAEADTKGDAVSHAINSPRGRSLEAFIRLALTTRRLERSDAHEFRATFDRELASSEIGQNADFAALAGMYCANLHYIDAEWTESNFDRLFSLANDSAWNCAAQGFAYQRHLYPWLYSKLIDGGHLRRMIYGGEVPDKVAEKALQFLGLAYLEGIEDFESGLLASLISDLRVRELSRICWFFWTLRSPGQQTPRDAKVIAFWIKVADRIRESGKEEASLQSSLSQLAIYIHDLTPRITAALADAAPFADVKHNGYMLMENLSRLAKDYPIETLAVFKSLLGGFLPEYRQEDIVQFVNGIADGGRVEDAEWICNVYAERNSQILKKTYEELRAKQRMDDELQGE